MSDARIGTLYLVPTPIGNLEDITYRAVRVLGAVGLVLAEDTRTTRHLLDHYAITARVLSYTEHNHAARLGQALAALAAGDVALVSEAGMPAINDPGQALVAAVVAAGFAVVGLPGASAVPLAVAVSGLAIRSFTFLGFLPHARGERRRLLQGNAAGGHALVAFETPHRLRDALADILAVCGDRQLAVCRELTKLHEEVFRGAVREALVHFTEPRGEVTLVIAGAPPQSTNDAKADTDELRAFLLARAAAGERARDAVSAAVARFALPRRRVYALWEQLKGEQMS